MKQLIKSLFTPSEPLWENKELAKPSYAIHSSRIQKQNAIVQEIHDTFYSEVDRLLAEAGIKVSDKTEKADLLIKASRLSSLGFNSTKEVSEAEVESKRISEAADINSKKQDLIDAINYFSFNYPQYKFISEESVKKICQKYGLIYGEASKYKGEVPDKNLDEIEKFSVKDEDCIFEQGIDWKRVTSFQTPEKKFIDYKTHKIHELNLFNLYAEHNLTVVNGELKSTNEFPVDLNFGSINWAQHTDLYNLKGKKVSLEIAAPIKDFNTRNMEVKDFKLSKIEVPDPVVLHPVMFKGIKHYLIVTAWGLEASDELVVNERNN
jgi:hypothetical protein